MTRSNCHQSKLFHTQLVREILLQEINDLPIHRDYAKFKAKASFGQTPIGFNKFKKDWLKARQAEMDAKVKKQATEEIMTQKQEVLDDRLGDLDPSSLETFMKSDQFKSLDQKRREMVIAAQMKQKNLKPQGKVMLNVVKDKGEVLVSTSFDSLHKHGYKPFMRWGVLKETLTAACIVESGILEKARKTGKLYVWDPFCGSGSFLIETMMMIAERPCRSLDEEMPFEVWPIHQAKAYEKFKEEMQLFKAV